MTCPVSKKQLRVENPPNGLWILREIYTTGPRKKPGACRNELIFYQDSHLASFSQRNYAVTNNDRQLTDQTPKGYP